MWSYDQSGSDPDQRLGWSPSALLWHLSASARGQSQLHGGTRCNVPDVHLPVLMLSEELLGLGSGLGKASLYHLAPLFDTPVQQEALVGSEQLQLVGLLQLLLPDQTLSESTSAVMWVEVKGVCLTELSAPGPEPSGSSGLLFVCSLTCRSALRDPSVGLRPLSPEPVR